MNTPISSGTEKGVPAGAWDPKGFFSIQCQFFFFFLKHNFSLNAASQSKRESILPFQKIVHLVIFDSCSVPTSTGTFPKDPAPPKFVYPTRPQEAIVLDYSNVSTLILLTCLARIINTVEFPVCNPNLFELTELTLLRNFIFIFFGLEV